MKPIPELSAWLAKCGMVKINPVTVTIGKKSWVACDYTRINTWQPDMQGVRDGRHKAGETYETRAIYCVGELPLEYKPKRHKYPLDGVCFPMDGIDWYIASYMPLENLSPVYEEYHPFGINFQLMPWNLPEKIDQYERKPYKRYPLTVKNETNG